MNIAFTPGGWEDYTYWQGQDRKTLRRLNRLIDAATRDPATGIGQPEALKNALQGAWSRRVNSEDRLVYRVEGDTLVIMQARFHYADH